MPYEITHCYKEVSEWTDQGSSTTSTSHGDLLRVPIIRETLADAVDDALEAFCLPKTYLFVPADDDGTVSRFSVNRVEDADGDEPTTHEESECAAGRLTLYLCDYDFSVRYVEERPINAAEIEALKAARPGLQIEG